MGRSETDWLLQKRKKTNMIITLVAKAIAVCALIACGMLEKPQMIRVAPHQQVDSRLLHLFENFKLDCVKYRLDCDRSMQNIVSVIVVPDFSHEPDVTDDTAGLCYPGIQNGRIEVKESMLKQHTRVLQGLLYHEIAHCAYFTRHVVRSNTLISPYMPSNYLLKFEWSRLVRELFHEIEVQYAN